MQPPIVVKEADNSVLVHHEHITHLRIAPGESVAEVHIFMIGGQSIQLGGTAAEEFLRQYNSRMAQELEKIVKAQPSRKGPQNGRR